MPYTRLNKSAKTFSEVITYYEDRAKQLLSSNFFWTTDIEEVTDKNGVPLGARTTFKKGNKEYVSVYVYEQVRGNGTYAILADKKTDHIITVPDCDLESYLLKHGYDFTVADPIPDKTKAAYNFITKAYGSRTALRSKVPYMYHIDEGIYILKEIGASDDTIGGYMLHPIFQDKWLSAMYSEQAAKELDVTQVMYAMEYEKVANDYLAHRKIDNIDEIVLSSIPEVNQMLVADKIQNTKDFMNHHHGVHERSQELTEYFFNWFKKLDIDQKFASELVRKISKVEI